MLKAKDGINTNASTATILRTSRTINGTYFNGSSNITTANWGTARTLTIGNTGKSVNGSGNVSWSLSEIGALSTGGGNLTGMLTSTYTPPINAPIIRLHTNGDGNSIGDGNTHLAYNTGNGYSHYFRGTGVTYINTLGGCAVSENLVVSKSSYFGYSMYIGNEGETDYRAVSVRRVAGGVQYEGRFCASYANNVKLSTSSTATVKYGAAMDCQQGGATKNRVILTQDCMIPSSDNVSYCGASSHRWQAIYASTGTVYSSSKDEKSNITPIQASLLKSKSTSIKDIIKDGIKNTNIYSYSYKTLENDSVFVGFLGQELEEKNPQFFNLIGSSYTTEQGNQQYDIRESSVIGILWSALQDVISENEQQEERIKKLEEQVSDLTTLLKN